MFSNLIYRDFSVDYLFVKQLCLVLVCVILSQQQFNAINYLFIYESDNLHLRSRIVFSGVEVGV